MLIDSHCHLDCLDLSLYDKDLTGLLLDAKRAGVEYILNACVTLEGFPQILAIAKEYDNVVVAVGVQPSEQVVHEPKIAEIAQLADNSLVVAIGEVGLDYYYDSITKELQQQRFRNHIRAAKEINKPLLIHTRAANKDTLQILKEEGAAQVGGVLHCFTEDWAMAEAAMKMNFYISFSGIITFKNATVLQEVAKQLPLDKILIETDAPYLAPVPYRGKPNQPAYLRHIAEHLAKLRNLSLETIAQTTSENFFELFAL